MRRAFYSRRHRDPHRHDEKQKEPPFFSKSDGKERAAFFRHASGTKGPAVQTKLDIGPPGAGYEQEAGRAASALGHGRGQSPMAPRREMGSVVQRVPLATPLEDERLDTAESRMEKDKLVQNKPEAGTRPPSAAGPEEKKKKPVQMQPAAPMTGTEKKKKEVPAEAGPPSRRVQRESDSGGTTAGPRLSRRLQDSAGKGKPLSGNTRAEMQSAIGPDFGSVSIHTDNRAAEMNKKLGAQAFTHGRDVYFNSGKFRPETADGKRLLAHELTHVVQQRGGDRVSPNRSGTSPATAIEPEAAESSFTFDGSTKARDALLTLGDFEAAERQGDACLSDWVIRLNHGQFPETGAMIVGDAFIFHVVLADSEKRVIHQVELIRREG